MDLAARDVALGEGTGRLTRRQLLRRAGGAAGGLAALLLLVACRGQGVPTPSPDATPEPPSPDPEPPPTATPVVRAGMRLRFLTASGPIPAADDQLRALVAEWGRQTGAEVAVETVSPVVLRSRLAAAGAGDAPDIVQCRDNLPWLFAERLADLSSQADQLSAAQGGYYDVAAAQARVEGAWRALPLAIAPGAIIYRADWLKAAGVSAFPATTAELLPVATALKGAGHPFGAPAGRSVEDPRALWYPVLWAFGGREVEADGKTVAINSPATVAALDWAAQFWRGACLAEGLLWDDNANNRLYAGGELGATLNGTGLYAQLRRDLPDIAAQSAHAPFPQGPGGQGGIVATYGHAVLAASPRADAAAALLLWLGQRERVERYLDAAGGALVGAQTGFEAHPRWAQPAVRGLLAAARLGRWPGWPGPPGRAAAESANHFVVVDLFANVLAGQPAQAALAAAEAALRGIFL